MSARQLLPFFASVILISTIHALANAEDDVVEASEPTTQVTFTRDLPIAQNGLERLLRIRSLCGKFELESGYNSISLRLDFYRAGKRIELGKTDAGGAGKELRRHGQFLVQILDLDYLKLGDGPESHWRIYPQLMTTTEPDGFGVTASPGNIDVPKSKFDAIPRTGGMGRFEEFPKEFSSPRHEYPIFWSASGRVKREKSLEALLDANPDSDILVGVLVCNRFNRAEDE